MFAFVRAKQILSRAGKLENFSSTFLSWESAFIYGNQQTDETCFFFFENLLKSVFHGEKSFNVKIPFDFHFKDYVSCRDFRYIRIFPCLDLLAMENVSVSAAKKAE